MTKKKVLINNSISGVCQLVITALLTFFSIPVFIHKLGTDLYGVFALVSVIGNLNLLSRTYYVLFSLVVYWIFLIFITNKPKLYSVCYCLLMQYY